MNKPTCETCQAYYPLSNECRRHAPAAVPVPQTNQLGQVVGYAAAGLFPATTKAHGCCEHIPEQLETPPH